MPSSGYARPMITAPLLVADVGGTSSRLALSDGPTLRLDTVRSFGNEGFSSFTAVLRSYLAEHPVAPAAIALAGAGPVTGDRIRLTNRNWTISAPEIATLTGCTNITLMNDLQAMGHALAVPSIAGSPLTQTRLVLAIGTGINAAVAHPTPGGAFVPTSEAGYSTLPVTTQQDAALLAKLPVPAIESVLSGPGLTRLHQLRTGDMLPPEQITRTSSDTLNMALRLLGAHLGTLALTHLPMGGLYLAGSVGRALHPHLNHPEFRDHYTNRGPYSDLVSAIPLRVIESDTAPLLGLAQHMANRTAPAPSFC
ncbi:glucokinase [Alisedimentitalea sp. MJ-SS2]|uniref:glucokinase n=1 Tax=Aliisedimentitalea sp. MJ-SS2 TaxID=3049795 RepID=UPI002910020D|nr:glucokinase [Alisedimentitalea sp. MJ-SS2]MDU8929723.1 glucokinase [Alisedimentitalea sp. MJ-SS2]